MLLEGQLNSFSFGELTMEEAAQLKKSFMFFKNRLEEKVHGIKMTDNIQILDGTDYPAAQDPTPKKTDVIKDESLLVTLYHEFRAPVNEILGFADVITEGTLDREQLEQIRAISKIANNLSGMLNELQEYIELATEKGKSETIDFNLSRIVRDTLFLCNTLIVHREVRLSVDIDQKIPICLLGDPSKLSQILLYLLGNVIKCVNEGDIRLEVRLREDHWDSCSLQFQINHEGIGKSRIAIAQFYNSLTRTEAPGLGKFLDNGFGPHIIKQLVGNLKGFIPAGDTLGSAAMFSFYLPYKKGTGLDNRYHMDHFDLDLTEVFPDSPAPDSEIIPMPGKTHLGKIWLECSGEVDLLEELIALFKRNVLEYIGKLKIYLPLGEFEKIRTATLKMRASACLVRADSLLPIIDTLLTNCRTVRDIHNLNRLYDQFLATYPSLEYAIDEELKFLKNNHKF